MTIEKAARHPIALTIDQAANGYMVTEVVGRGEVAMYYDAHVFPSKAALFAHLAAHFTHEAVSVPMDKAPPMEALRGDMQPATDPVGFTNFGRRE